MVIFLIDLATMWLLKHHAQRKEKNIFNISRYIKKALVANERYQKQLFKKKKKRYQKQKCITALTLATAIGRIAIKTNIKSSG